MPNRLIRGGRYRIQIGTTLLCLMFAAVFTGGGWRPAFASPLASSACPALAAPSGPVVNVSTEEQLWNAINSASTGQTILLADGTYHLARYGYYVWIDTPGITLRSASGNRDGVILDDEYLGTETISILASNVTVADLTIWRSGTHGIHVVATDAADTLQTKIYHVKVLDPGEQGIKINANAAKTHGVDAGEIACSHIELSDAGRGHVSACYTGGIDAHWARDWVVRDNRIEGFWCTDGLSEHAIHFWNSTRDPLIERNFLVNNARGIGFGMNTSGTPRPYGDTPCSGTVGYVDHYRGVIRNNFIFANRASLFQTPDGFDNGISLWNACEVKVVHNTVVSTQAPLSASIEWRFQNTSVELKNNLTSHGLLARDSATAVQAGNLNNQPLNLFVNGTGGDLHLSPLASQAIDQGVALAAGLCTDDYDAKERPVGAGPDVGADESGNTPPPLLIYLPLIKRS